MCKCCCVFGLITEQNVIEPTSLASRREPECKHITSRASRYLTCQLCKGMPLWIALEERDGLFFWWTWSLSESQALKLKKMRVLTQTTIYYANAFPVSGAGSRLTDRSHPLKLGSRLEVSVAHRFICRLDDGTRSKVDTPVLFVLVHHQRLSPWLLVIPSAS